VGTLPSFADPRDPAGFPYNTVDPAPDIFERPGEEASWVTMSRAAP
jgi:hypothetical protein